MPPRKQAEQPKRHEPQLVEQDGVLYVRPARFKYRVLLPDSTYVDVVGPWDDSNLRGLIVEHTGQRIAGISDGVPDGWFT